MTGGKKLRVLDLFSGIGGFSLGLERATLEGAETDGFETVAFCEIEEFPRRVLAKHWPHVPCYHDVRELTAERLAADGIAVDVITGGFPCQDISTAGNGAGLDGERSGLWSEIARLVGELRPAFLIVENVANLLAGPSERPGGWFGRVLGDLAKCGYDAEWHCIPASAVGAPHRRDRIWIMAHPSRLLCNGGNDNAAICVGGSVSELGNGSGAHTLADSVRWGRQGQGQPFQSGNPTPLIQRQAVDAFHGGVADIWSAEPNVGRVANGVPDRAHRLKALGNAVVPQIPELIGRAILQAINSAPYSTSGADSQRGVSIELPHASLATVSEPVHVPQHDALHNSCQCEVSGCLSLTQVLP